MANKNYNSKITKRKIVGLISLIVFSLVFIFACLKNVLPIGKLIVGTFGVLAYPMSLIFAFISLATFLGFSYSKNPKPIVLFAIALFSVLLAVHSISTYKSLDTVITFSNMKGYLNVSYKTTTLVGSFGSILCGLISMLLGAMGTIVVYVILATIFSGLLLDYEIYGKYQEPHIKKLKTRKIREKVSSSDANLTNDGSPNYSFNETNVVDEISVDATNYSNLNSNTINYQTYQMSEPVATITSSEDFGEFTYKGGNYSNHEEVSNQTLNTFDTEKFFKQGDMPDVYNPDRNDFRREFMNATFGTTAGTSNVEENNYATSTNFAPPTNFDDLSNFDLEENASSSNDLDTGFSGFNSDDSNISSSAYDTELSNILNSSDDDIEDGVGNDIASNAFDKFGKTENLFKGFASNLNETNSDFVQNENLNNYSNFNNQEPEQKERFGSGFNPFEAENKNMLFGSNYSSQPQSSEFTGMGFSMQPQPPKVEQKPVTIPQKEQKKYVTEIGMPGVRYNAPPLSLLKTPEVDRGDYSEEQARKTAQLENALASFGINAKVVNIIRGPKITRYELSVPLGVPVKKIPSYELDIQRALAATTINIKAPIPGSSYVGIELENDTYTTVYQRELFESEAFQKSKETLPIAIGKDISGEIVVKSLTDLTHLLIAGSTGSGKSVFIHNIVLSLIFKSSPDDLRLIMIDPKRVEFPIYNGLPHLLTPEVVQGSQKAINALKWCVKEMDRRYDLMAKAGFNNIKPYNKSDLVKAGQFEKFPYIVIVVDELAEIMQANKKEAEACIQRITQLARACGMHMIIATQRPSVDIITGVIKNNIPSRVALSLQSGIDSKTILNTVGAEKLLGKGDMIYAPTGTSVMSRLQGSYATDGEIKAVIDYVIKNNQANYDAAVEKAMDAENEAESSGAFVGGDGVPPQKDALDPYFKVALKIVMQNGGASTSYLQRRLSIGYSRAAKIMDQMADRGFIGEASGQKQRKILITPEMFREQFGEDYTDN